MPGQREAAVGRSRRTATPLLLIAGWLLSPAPGWGCGFDGLISDGFGASHPRSIGVALAIADAIGEGVLDRSAAAPIIVGSAGYWRAVGRLSAVGQALAGEEGLREPVAILLIDSNLWARLVPSIGRPRLEAHAPGPGEGDVVVVTSEPVLAALLEQGMAPAGAIDRGLVAVEGPDTAASVVRASLAGGLRSGHAPRPAVAAFRRVTQTGGVKPADGELSAGDSVR